MSFVCFGVLPKGHIVRTIEEYGDAWASDISWLSGDSSAVWIVHIPNNRELDRLVYWDGYKIRTIIPIGVVSYVLSLIDSHDIALVGCGRSDTLGRYRRSLFWCEIPSRCSALDIPIGDLSALARWNALSDTVYYALCTDPYSEPKRFFVTEGKAPQATKLPLPIGYEFPLGLLPEDTLPSCWRAIAPENPTPKPDTIIAGKIPATNLSFLALGGTISIADSADTMNINLFNVSGIREMIWNRDCSKALVSCIGNPNRLILLMLVK